MRLLPPRFTLRRLMVVVTALGLALGCFLGQSQRHRRGCDPAALVRDRPDSDPEWVVINGNAGVLVGLTIPSVTTNCYRRRVVSPPAAGPSVSAPGVSFPGGGPVGLNALNHRRSSHSHSETTAMRLLWMTPRPDDRRGGSRVGCWRGPRVSGARSPRPTDSGEAEYYRRMYQEMAEKAAEWEELANDPAKESALPLALYRAGHWSREQALEIELEPLQSPVPTKVAAAYQEAKEIARRRAATYRTSVE